MSKVYKVIVDGDWITTSKAAFDAWEGKKQIIDVPPKEKLDNELKAEDWVIDALSRMYHHGYKRGYKEAVEDQKAVAAVPRLAPQDQVLLALRAAKQFIENGIEMGYIRMPESFDPANHTLPLINAAIEAHYASKG